jgi:hypothetical protein
MGIRGKYKQTTCIYKFRSITVNRHYTRPSPEIELNEMLLDYHKRGQSLIVIQDAKQPGNITIPSPAVLLIGHIIADLNFYGQNTGSVG